MKTATCPGWLRVLESATLVAALGAAITHCTDATTDATNESAVGEISLWPTNPTPVHPSDSDTAAVELGTRFRADTDGTVTGVRFYKSAQNTGVHTGSLWSSSGARLATVTFAGESAAGWQTARFATPVAIQAGRTYVISYHTNVGHYAGDNGYFTGRRVDSGPLHAPADSSTAHNGVYRYGASAFPNGSWQASNYWVDVLFKPVGSVTDAGTGSDSGSLATDGGSAPTDSGTPAVDAASVRDSGGTPVDSGVTPSDSGTPASLRNCAASPHLCGYPDATNTGPRAGTVFRRVPQDVTAGPGWAWDTRFARLLVSGAGAVLDGLDVSGPVVIDAPNVTLRNSIVTFCDAEGDVVAVRAGNPANGYNAYGARIENNRLRCATAGQRARSGIRDVYGAADDLLARANEISGTGNGITLERNGRVTDNWIHDLGHLAGDHHSGLSNHGGATGVVFAHNTALLANTPTTGGGGLSGAITVYGDFARAQNVTITDNLVSGGAYTFYGGINNETTYGQPVEIHIDGNRLVCGSWVYGPVFRREGATNSFTGNVCDQDGSPVSG